VGHDTRGAASRINNRSEVVGYLTPDSNFQSYVYTWTREGGTVNIGGYPGGFVVGTPYGNVFGITGLSQVVATSTFPGDEITRQLLWSGGEGPFVIAEDSIPDYSHMGINDVGEVAGATRAEQAQMTAAVWMTAAAWICFWLRGGVTSRRPVGVRSARAGIRPPRFRPVWRSARDLRCC
jgi:hypothetical protein